MICNDDEGAVILVIMGMPPPPGFTPAPIKEDNHALTMNETAMILRKTLHPVHADDPNVLRFINEFLNCRDTRQAALKAGIQGPSGKILRNRPDIAEAIKQLTEKAVLKYGFDAEDLVERVKEIAFVDPADVFNADGSYKNIHLIPPEVRRAIKKIKCRNLFGEDPNGMKIIIGEIMDIEFVEKTKGIELLGREKDTFKETKRVEHDITKNMQETLLDSKRRAEHRMLELGSRLTPAEPPIDVTPEDVGD